MQSLLPADPHPLKEPLWVTAGRPESMPLNSGSRISRSKHRDSGMTNADGQGLNLQGFKDQGYISVAVVVQPMVQSEISGIAFSVHPVTQDRNQLIIEAGFGLGEAIVSGQITPDSYVVTKNPLEIIDKNISEQTRMLVRSRNGGNEWVPVDLRVEDRSVAVLALAVTMRMFSRREAGVTQR